MSMYSPNGISPMSRDLNIEEFLLQNKMFFELANYYRANKEYTNAVYFLKKEINRNEDIAYKVILIDCYIEQKSYEQALLFVDDVSSQIQHKSLFYYTIQLLHLECLVNLNELEDALKLISQLSMNHQLEEEVYAWQAVIFLKSGDYNQAQASYAKSIKLNSNMEKSWLGLGSVHCLKGDYELGLACFKKTLDINKNNTAAINLITKYTSRI